jgi:hypothetical protein
MSKATRMLDAVMNGENRGYFFAHSRDKSVENREWTGL